MTDSDFIQSDNWQSDKAGLVAGERLLLQLQRLEQAYLDSNVREIEVGQSLSLLQIDPGALQALQATGSCTFVFPPEDVPLTMTRAS